MKGYSLEYIGNLRIHELRDFAKQLGVSSPTTMKKDELISQITTIMDRNKSESAKNMPLSNVNEVDFLSLLACDNSGILAEFLSNNNSSNKTNNIPYLDAMEKDNAVILKKNKHTFEVSDTYDIPRDDLMRVSFSLRQDEAKYKENDFYEVSGYLDIHPSGYGIIRSNGFLTGTEDVYLTSAMIKQFNLRKGNFVRVHAKYAFINKPRIAYEILDVDGMQKPKNHKSFDAYSYNGLGDKLHLDKFKLAFKKGERNYIEHMSLEDAVSFGYDLVDENGVDVKFINVKARPEENYQSHQKMQIINIPFNRNGEDVLCATDLIIERIKREFEQKKNNILIVYNISELLWLFNTAFGDGYLNYEKYNFKALNKIQDILYLAKYVDKYSSNTVIFIDRNGVSKHLEQVMEYELKPLFNNIISQVDKK